MRYTAARATVKYSDRGRRSGRGLHHRAAAALVVGALACPAQAAGDAEPALRVAAVYQWVDEHGKVHFSDRKPPDPTLAVEDRSPDFQSHHPFTVTIEAQGYAPGAVVESQVLVATKKIHEVFVNELGLRFESAPAIRIRIFAQRADYEGYGKIATRHLGLTDGYYSARDQEIVVWRNVSPEKMLQVITHEVSHALVGSRLEYVPAWLDEGLAEYFERMHVFGQAVSVPPSDGWDRTVTAMLEQGTLMPLAEYLAMDDRDWYERNGPDAVSYAQAWSLAFFLMSSADGRALVAELFGELDTQDRESFSSLLSVDRRYPGGIARLEADWRYAVGSRKRPHRY